MPKTPASHTPQLLAAVGWDNLGNASGQGPFPGLRTELWVQGIPLGTERVLAAVFLGERRTGGWVSPYQAWRAQMGSISVT